MHGTDRLERELRDWLAAEAAAIELPAGLAERVSGLEPPAVARRGRLSWARLPRRVVLLGVTLLLVAALVAGLVLAGLLPFGPDCSRVSIESVRAAADAVPGYRYSASATELTDEFVFSGQDEPPTFAYSTAEIDVTGGYRAPEAWVLEVVRLEYDSPIPPHGALWILQPDVDAFLHAEGASYARTTGASQFTRLVEGEMFVDEIGPNLLADLLLGRPFRSGSPGREVNPLTWTVGTEGGTCRLSAANAIFSSEQGRAWELTFEIDPDTLLAGTVSYRWATPEIPFLGDTGSPAQDVRWQFTFDYSTVPAIEPPTDPDVPPVTEERALEDASAGGAGIVIDRTGLSRGSTELWVVRGTEGIAVLRYEGGLLAATVLLDRADDVIVQIVDGDEARFLLAVVNEPRVSHVRVELTASDTLRLPAEGSPIDDRPIIVVDAGGLGDVVTWWAYDENDRELVVNPRPPG